MCWNSRDSIQQRRSVFPFIRSARISNFPLTFIQSVRTLPDSLFSLFFPASCRVCRHSIERFTTTPVCAACVNAVRACPDARCRKCGLFLQTATVLHGLATCRVCRSGAFVFEQARSFAWYDDTLRTLIHLLKYQGFQPLAKPLGAWLGSLTTEFERQQFDLVIPVPLHVKRQRQRGFNQAALLAAHVSQAQGIPLGARNCVRVRDTRPQTGLRAAERRKNVAGAFQVPRAESVKGRRVLLIDDVMTTGATVNSCARALLDAGAQGVWVVTLARVHPRNVDVI